MNEPSYNLLNQQVLALLDGEDNLIAAMANFSALINDNLGQLNWVGFYLKQGDQLVLGPFQGKVACSRIAMGQGVCGTAAASKQTQRIADVHQFDGHIACDAASNSELVIPVFHDEEVIAVLDIDSPEFKRFTEQDQLGLEQMVHSFERCVLPAKP